MHNTNLGEIITVIGLLLLLGLLIESIAKRVHLPRVSLLLLLGFLAGPSVLDWLPIQITSHFFELLTSLAISMIGFLIGLKITQHAWRYHAKYILGFSISVALVTFACVFIGLSIFQVSLSVALFLAALSVPTDPAATIDVIDELKADSPFAKVLERIVPLDDAWALLFFSIAMILVHVFHGHYAHVSQVVLNALWEVFGAIILGVVIGAPAAYFSGRVRSGEPTLLEALGIVFLGCGLALSLHVSFILTMIVVGVIVSHFAKHHVRPFHAIEHIDWPFMVLFFILGGSQFSLNELPIFGVLGGLYIVLRVIGRVLGSWIGGSVIHAERQYTHWMGASMLSQAGVSIGMALIAVQAYPQYESLIMPVVLASAVIFEIFGPIVTRQVLRRVS